MITQVPSRPDPDKELELSRLGGGANQAGARAYNERLALSLIRRNGPLPKAELARLTGLSAQTLSTMMRRLEADALVIAQKPLRGRIGQPSIPFALNPEGAMSFGLKIGRRSTDLMLCDFHGAIRERAKVTYAYPVPRDVFAFVGHHIQTIRSKLRCPERIIGTGIAMPFELWKWADEVDAPPGVLDGWRDLDVAGEVRRISGVPAILANDATAACGAELARIEREARTDFLYIFIGSFVGGGVVLNGTLVSGRSGNAGALGSMPVHIGGRTSQLIQHASLITLEKALLAAGIDAGILQDPQRDWSDLGAPLTCWIETTATALATAVVAGVAIIDFPRVCIDGALPAAVRDAIVDLTRARVATMDLQGLTPFEITAGTLGADARALGGAMLPILAGYACDPEVLLKDVGGMRV